LVDVLPETFPLINGRSLAAANVPVADSPHVIDRELPRHVEGGAFLQALSGGHVVAWLRMSNVHRPYLKAGRRTARKAVGDEVAGSTDRRDDQRKTDIVSLRSRIVS
jgi:hypothetical protein